VRGGCQCTSGSRITPTVSTMSFAGGAARIDGAAALRSVRLVGSWLRTCGQEPTAGPDGDADGVGTVSATRHTARAPHRSPVRAPCGTNRGRAACSPHGHASRDISRPDTRDVGMRGRWATTRIAIRDARARPRIRDATMGIKRKRNNATNKKSTRNSYLYNKVAARSTAYKHLTLFYAISIIDVSIM
jgi:hypothetical protein